MRLIYENRFKKDFKRIEKQGKPVDVLDEVTNQLLENKRLDVKYRDHQLKGKLKEYRECHLSGNWLLMYTKTDTSLILARTGSHSELFK